MKTPEVDQYLERINTWQDEIHTLRTILLDCGLTETYKWKAPCYTFGGKNIVIIGNFKANCTLSFLKGVLLQDAQNLLVLAGENSQAVKLMKFKSVPEITALESTIKSYVFEAIEIEKSGIKTPLAEPTTPVFCEELIRAFDQNQAFKTSFESLTKGRQRGYHLFFNAAKQPQTRQTRIEKSIPQILDGKGMNDCTCGLTKRPPGCDGSHQLII